LLPERLVISVSLSVWVCLAALVLFALPVSSVLAAEPPVTVEADKLEYEDSGQVIKAEGQVVVEWNGNRLEAGRVQVQQEARTLEADGQLTFESPLLNMKAESCFLEVDSETGSLTNVTVLPKDRSGRFGAERIEKLEGRRYRLENGFFTTCKLREGGSPDWELTGKELDIELDGYGRLQEGAFRVRGVPVLYLPVAVFPTKQTRQSGLLRPTLGSSNRRGFVYSQPMYLALDKHRDLTLSAELQTAARVGTTANYRARSNKSTWTDLSGAYYNEQIRGDTDGDIRSPVLVDKHIGENRGFVDLRHRQDLEGQNLQLYANVLAASDDVLFREIDSFETGDVDSEYRRSLRYARSTAGALGWQGNSSYGGFLEGRQNFYGEHDETLQRPLGAWFRRDEGLGPVALEVGGNFDSFIRDGGPDGQRLLSTVRASMPLLTGRRGALRGWVEGRGLGYRLDDRREVDDEGDLAKEYEQNFFRGTATVGVEASTRVARTFNLGAGRLLRHTLEPFAGFSASSDSSIDDTPLFDGNDHFDGRDMARVGVDSGFFVKEADGTVVEVARVAILSGYNFSEDVIDDGFTDIDFAGLVRPTQTLSLRTLTSVNPSAGVLTGAQASVLWEPGPLGLLRGSDNRLGLAYRFVRGGILESTEGRARFAFTDSLSMGVKGRYDLESQTFVEKGGSLRLSSACDCWAVDFGLVTLANPAETQFRVLVELAGLGDVGRGVASRSSPAMDEIAYDDLGFWRSGW
jgi:hypothetical protein